MAELTPAQQSHLRSSLARIDELLSDAMRALDQQGDTPFGKHRPDATPIQRKVVADYARSLRARAQKALDDFHVPPSPGTTGTVTAARTAILFAQVALQEIEPRTMRGYGPLSKDAAKELSAVSAELMEVLHDIDAYLAQGSGHQLAERLRRLELPSMDGHALGELERVITAHGLTELRPALEILADRLEAPQLEVAVFGRTSAGKSSLLNRLLQTTALPVGVTPVTAVPVRIMYGAKPWARAWFADAIPESFPLGRLAEFVDAHYNPANVRHVTRITVELPAGILQRGIALVDTPGLGSLATAGAAETLAYLPHCDLGIVLVDAASSLTHEDVALVDALHRASASVMVLLTKSDLLSPDERLTALGYVRRELETRAQIELPLHAVSVVGADAALCDAWRDEVLLPSLQAHKRGLQLSLRRKLGLLRDTALATLERRLETDRDSPAVPAATEQAAANRRLAEALESLETRIRGGRPVFPDPDLAVREIVDDVAHNAAVLWSRSADRTIDVSGLLGASLSGKARAGAQEILRDLVRLRAGIAAALAEAVGASHLRSFDEELPQVTGMPAFDCSSMEALQLRRPALALGLPLRRWAARRQLLRGDLMQQIDRLLMEYQARLLDWRAGMLDALRRAFSSQRSLLRPDDGVHHLDEAEQRRIAADIEGLKRLGNRAANESVGAAR